LGLNGRAPVGALHLCFSVLMLGGVCVRHLLAVPRFLLNAYTAVGLSQSLAPLSGTLSRILSGTRRSVQTVSGVYLKRYFLLSTNAFSALRVLVDNCAIALLRYINLLTYLLFIVRPK